MPLVKKRVTVAAGATSDQILAGTTYEYVNPNTRIVVAAQDATGTYEAATNLNFTVNIALKSMINLLSLIPRAQQLE